MSPDQIVTNFITAIERQDIDTATSFLHDDCEYDNVPMGKVFGPDDIRGLLEPMIVACSTVEWIVHRQAATGNVVFNERLDRFEMPFGWLEVPVTGVFEIADDRIILWRDYFDLATYRDQLPAA